MFELLCGILYVIGLMFGWTYEEASVHVCIEWWPMICTFSIVPIFVGLVVRIVKGRKRILSLYLLPLVVCYFVYFYTMSVGFIGHYMIDGASIHSIFMHCMHDLQHIAAVCNTTYEHVNMVIYVYLFTIIMAVNGFLTWLSFPRKKRQKQPLNTVNDEEP